MYEKQKIGINVKERAVSFSPNYLYKKRMKKYISMRWKVLYEKCNSETVQYNIYNEFLMFFFISQRAVVNTAALWLGIKSTKDGFEGLW